MEFERTIEMQERNATLHQLPPVSQDETDTVALPDPLAVFHLHGGESFVTTSYDLHEGGWLCEGHFKHTWFTVETVLFPLTSIKYTAFAENDTVAP